MSAAWTVVVALIVTSALTRAAGPLALGGRDLPPRVVGVLELLAPALLTALIVAEALGENGDLHVDESLVGVGAAGVLLARRPHALLSAIVIAAGITAGLRALG